MTNDLRAELQKITREHPTQHLELVAELNERRPHSISLARDANGRPVHIVANCFEYAFGLTVFEEYENIRLCDFQERLDRFIANSMFMCHLLKKGILKAHADPREGDVVLYFKDGRPVHAGLVKRPNRVISKWGTGHFWEHGLWDVPMSYGGEARYYDRPDPAEVFDAFTSWMQTQPGYADFEAKYADFG